ncbi:MAG TPA: protein kinase [Gemmatimonadaceae bacterium]|nr:protein kinase [Gemmatimonadaceae bacterium]
MEATTHQISLSTLQAALAGRYAFERELGRGGMASVFLARDLTRDKYVAVKVLLPELAVTLGQERFLREIEVGTVLQHPRIVGVLDSGQADGLLYYVMPFVDGASLRERLNREKQLPVDDTIKIAQQVAEALAYAHSKGVIHRDIKPENILLDASGAMVADFGIARAVSVAGGETLTRTGMAVGTPTYMSPEQAMGSKDVTPESDIYSLACVVYELLAGQPPFTGPTAMALLARHSLDNVPSLKIVRNTIPDAVEDAILRAMAKVPADRFHSATDFATALTDDEGAARRRRDSLKAKALAAETVERPALGGGSKTKTKKRVMMAAAVAVPLLAAGGWFGWKATQGPSTPEGLTGDYAKNNIAVLYFDDRSPGKQVQHIADGITESLINELSAVQQLKVISPNGVAPFKGTTPRTDSVAKALKVGTLVTGVVTPASGGRLKVEVRLVDALTGDQIASTKIEQPEEKLLDLQDSLAHDMSLFLRKRVGAEIRELVSKAGTRNDAAWSAMQRARQIIRESDALVKAHDVPSALQKMATADSALAKVEAIDGNWREPIIQRAWLGYRVSRLVDPPDPNFAKAIETGLAHADRALKKAPDDGDAIEVRGTLHYWQWVNNAVPEGTSANALLESAEKDLRASIATNPRRASAWNVLSHLLFSKQQLTQAKLAAEEALNADPYLTDVDRTIVRLFSASADLGLRPEAVRWCNEGNRRFPENFFLTECKLWLYALPGPKFDMKDVWKTYDEVIQMAQPNEQEFYKLEEKLVVALAYVRANQLDSAKALAATSQGDSQIDPGGELTNLAATVYAQVGDIDTALELTAKYLAANPNKRAYAANDKSWWTQNLRADSRYQALVKTAN